MNRLTIRNSDGSVSQPTNTTIESVFDKLAEYEDAEEQGRLKALPIEIDGRAWIIDDNTVIPVRIMDYQIGDDGLAAHVECLTPPAWITINAARLYKSKEDAEAERSKTISKPAITPEQLKQWANALYPNYSDGAWHCSCGATLYRTYRYCPRCGQKLNWEDEE